MSEKDELAATAAAIQMAQAYRALGRKDAIQSLKEFADTPGLPAEKQSVIYECIHWLSN